jgi:hypothetical protein
MKARTGKTTPGPSASAPVTSNPFSRSSRSNKPFPHPASETRARPEGPLAAPARAASAKSPCHRLCRGRTPSRTGVAAVGKLFRALFRRAFLDYWAAPPVLPGRGPFSCVFHALSGWGLRTGETSPPTLPEPRCHGRPAPTAPAGLVRGGLAGAAARLRARPAVRGLDSTAVGLPGPGAVPACPDRPSGGGRDRGSRPGLAGPYARPAGLPARRPGGRRHPSLAGQSLPAPGRQLPAPGGRPARLAGAGRRPAAAGRLRGRPCLPDRGRLQPSARTSALAL